MADEQFDAKEEAQKLVEIVETLSKTGAPPSDLLATARLLVTEERFARQRKESERGLSQHVGPLGSSIGPGYGYDPTMKHGGLR